MKPKTPRPTSSFSWRSCRKNEMRIPLPSQRRRARIEIVPLIDIVFFLLATFVMVSMSMIKNRAIPVNLPAAATAAPEERKAFVTLTVSEEGFLYLNKEQISLEDLPARLRTLKSSDPELKVFIHGDQKASFGAAVRILDEVRKQGISKVAIQTTAPSAEPRETRS